MQSLVDTKRAGALLFVRSLAELPGAIRAVNDLLPRLGSSGDDVLGILVREELDSGLAKPSCEAGPGGMPSLELRGSAALSGRWSLCWFASTMPEERPDARWRRRRLLDLVLRGGPRESADRGAGRLVPVFTRAEASAGVTVRVAQLRARYPMVTIGPTCFVCDADARELVRMAALPLPRALRRIP